MSLRHEHESVLMLRTSVTGVRVMQETLGEGDGREERSESNVLQEDRLRMPRSVASAYIHMNTVVISKIGLIITKSLRG